MRKVNFDSLYEAIDQQISQGKTVLIAIDGNSTSGKTTLSQILKQKYNANVFHMDDFFRSKEQGKSDSKFGSNIDIERMNKELFQPIMKNQDIMYHSFDCKLQKMSKVKKQTTKQVNIIEGAYAMHPDLLVNYQIKVLLTSNKLQQILRIIKRNGVKELKNFLFKWIPKENAYLKFYHLDKDANFIFKSKH